MSAARKIVRYSRYELKQAVWHLRDVAELPQGFQRTVLVSPTDVANSLGFLFKDLPQETMIVAMLNQRNGLQVIDIVSVGTLNASLGAPREIFRSAIACLAAKIIIMHNHPSGNPNPSEDDIKFTYQIERCGQILGIPLVDSIIFAGGEITSLHELGYCS